MTLGEGVVPLSIFLYLSTIMYATPDTDTTFDKYDEMRLHMEQLLSASLLELDVPPRIAIPLGDAGIRRLKDLVRTNREELTTIKRIGTKAADKLEAMLNRYGLSFGIIEK